MKYLKKFNEELDNNTYQSAARKLDREAKKSNNPEFALRAKALSDYAESKGLAENIAMYGKYGKTTITIQYNKAGQSVTGDFYLLFDFDCFNFEDSYADDADDDKFSLQFSVGLIPVDMETRGRFSVLPDDDFDNGFFWGMWVSLDFVESGTGFELENTTLNSYDYNVSGKISFTRPLCGVIKKHLTACFADVDYPLNEEQTMYNCLEENVLAKCGVSSKFGITMEDLQEMVKKITPNQLMASIDDKQW